MLVPVTAFGVWAGMLMVGIGGSMVLDSLCPPDLMVSGRCMAPWHRPAMAALEMICAGAAAAGFVVLPAKVAPVYRVQVAAACFAVGALLTGELAVAGALWAPAAVAVITGVIALCSVIRRQSRSTS